MIAIGSDHGGFLLKREIIAFLKEKNIPYKDFGTDSSEPVDYPDISSSLAQEVAAGRYSLGILICGTGIGVSIVANKVTGIRAALCTNSYMARLSREHNNANVLALGERVIGSGIALDIVEAFLNTNFSGDRHQRRVEKITALEGQINDK